MTLRRTEWVLAPLFAVASLSCSSSSGAASGGTDSNVGLPIQASAFNGFCDWSSAEAVAAGDGGDGLHIGPLRVYWNQTPAPGSTAFPQGMLILKSSEEMDPTKRTIFAMAKVGGDYNVAGGVPNWKWFSLVENADCTVTQLWQGQVPPEGEMYSGQPIGDCNGCHSAIKANDYVWDTALQLSSF